MLEGLGALRFRIDAFRLYKALWFESLGFLGF